MAWGDVMRGLAGALQGYTEASDYQRKWEQMLAAEAQKAKQFDVNMALQRADLDERKRARIEKDRSERADALAKFYERQGIILTPDKVQQYVTGATSAPLGGSAVGGMMDLPATIADAATQAGRGLGGQFGAAGKTALDASTAGKGQRVDLGNGLGFAQDREALDQAQKLAEINARADAERRSRAPREQVVSMKNDAGQDVTGILNLDTKQFTPLGGKAGGGGNGLNGALSGITMQTMGRMGTSYNDLAQTIAEMEKMENDPAFRAKLTAWNKSKMAGAEAHPNADAHGIGGVAGNMLGQFAAGKAQESLDPELNTYLNLKQRVGTAFTELLPRPNQQLLQIEKGLSGIDVGWNPQLMAGIQARRKGGLEVLKNILGQQGMLDESGNIRTGGQRQAAPSGSSRTMSFEDWKKSKGWN